MNISVKREQDVTLNFHLLSNYNCAQHDLNTNFQIHTPVHILELSNQGWFSVARKLTDLSHQLPVILLKENVVKNDNDRCY